MEERLQKILARAGFGSRRSSEELIQAGRVQVNGQVAFLGSKADPERDRITVDGHPLAVSEPLTYILLYKPRNVLSTVTTPDARPTVRDLIPIPGQLYPVGRLDVDSEGLILLTNDGDLTNRLTHPRYGHEKEYWVLVARQPDEEQIHTWRRGVVMEDGYKTQPAEVRLESLQGKGAWLRIVLREGRKRQIRETGAILGLPVVRIIRVRIGSLLLGKLKPREWRRLTANEIAALKGQPEKAGPKQRQEQARPSNAKPGAKRSRKATPAKRSQKTGKHRS
jgi:23S rRNA pseudouridine2605 synthase